MLPASLARLTHGPLLAGRKPPPDLDVTTADIVGWLTAVGWLLFIGACVTVVGATVFVGLAYWSRDRARTRSPRPMARARDDAG
jgi:hypothetical protein